MCCCLDRQVIVGSRVADPVRDLFAAGRARVAPLRVEPGFRALRHDLPASLVVLLIDIPLSLGIAVASGAPVMAGLIAAAVGGIVAGLLGGSRLQVSGPAAGLTVVVADLIAKYG